MHIQTPRIRLLAATPELAQTEWLDPVRFSHLLAATIPAAWPPPLTAHRHKRNAEHLAVHPEQVGWWFWYIILLEPQPTAIGICALKGPPNPEGRVEIGYSVLPERQRRGYATEALGALIAWAFGHPQVTEILAQTYSHLRPSITVLERNGFRVLGSAGADGQVQYSLKRPTGAPA